MSLLKMKLTAVLGVTFATILSLVTAAPATAAPPEGMRWSDTVGATSRRQSQSMSFGQTVRSPLSYSPSPVTMTPTVGTPASTPATISVRGPDGVVRTYQVEGPVVQQGAPAFVSVLGSDGIVRTYQVVGGSTAAPVVTYPCR